MLGALTTKADYYNFFTEYSTKRIDSGQWSIENNNLISYRFSMSINSLYTYCPRYFTFTGTTTNNDELEFGVQTVTFNTNNVLFETDYYPSNTRLSIYSSWITPVQSNPNDSFIIYVRRKDGGIITPSSMENSSLLIECSYRETIVETTAIPQDWFETTTASFQNPMDTYTTIIPTDYDISSSQYDPLLEIPSKIDTAINFIILGFGRIMNFKYISFVVCFVLIVGLVAWLIH